MNIHEYQAKEIFKEFGVNVLDGIVAQTVDEAVSAAKSLGGEVWVVKAQIHAGGRGLGGGVKLAKSIDEVKQHASEILGMQLVTHQTGPQGKEVRKVYIESGASIEKEFYLSILLDRAKEMPVFMASTEGGMDIEKVAEQSPEKIIRVHVDPLTGFQGYHARLLGFGLGLEKEQMAHLYAFAKALYEVFVAKDAELIEINPLVKTSDGKFIALDGKMSFDDNALYRHKSIESLRDLSEEEPTEYEAKQSNLSYVKLDGSVGCMVNGAGLAMSTMDIIKHEGAEPANFLDVGGGANPQTVAKGFEIILRDKNVKAIFVNIFGGIVRCDRVANGILEATKITQVDVPVVVRLDGTNAEEAKQIIDGANLKNLISATDLSDGAKKVVQAAQGAN